MTRKPRDRLKKDEAWSDSTGPSGATLLGQRALELDGDLSLPVVRLRSVRAHPFLFRKLISRVDDSARPGDIVAVHTPQDQLLGYGLYNPRAEITVRMFSRETAPPAAQFWHDRLDQAVRLRCEFLRLNDVTDACRMVHAEADGLSGLMVDRFGDVLSAEVFSLAMYQRSHALLEHLQAILGTRHSIVQVAPQTHGQEGFLAEPVRSANLPQEVVITEHGTRFKVRFEGGHKTGFFCDQRDNRQRLVPFCSGKSVLDLCSYTGGFAVHASRAGAAAEVTAVDLDEKAIAVGRENARLNQVRVNFVHADVFGYMRDMLQNQRQYDVVVLDPPKLIRNRRELEEGTRKHIDLNRLAIQLVKPEGLFVSCTCSGLLGEGEFLRLIHDAARKSAPAVGLGFSTARGAGRLLQFLARTGAAPDHPVSGDCPETEYLKVAWMRVL